jgi:hypothetical protein
VGERLKDVRPLKQYRAGSGSDGAGLSLGNQVEVERTVLLRKNYETVHLMASLAKNFGVD